MVDFGHLHLFSPNLGGPNLGGFPGPYTRTKIRGALALT
jgi:hypothetical protein